MPVRYEIPNANDLSVPCPYCRGTGYQYLGDIGYRSCQYCVTGYKVKLCSCGGRGCELCMGHMHNFYSDLSKDIRVSLPDTGGRSFAGEVAPRASRTIPRR